MEKYERNYESVLHVFEMEISMEKYCIYFQNTLEYFLSNLKYAFHFKLENCENGFKYLIYMLKPNNYKVEDWMWLIKKVERRIDNWVFIFLSLGGRFTLI